MDTQNSAKGGAPLGNKNNVALPTLELKLKAYKTFCDHLAKGSVKQSWYYDDGKYMCSYQTLMSYIKESPVDFPAIQKEVAYSKGFQQWESVLSGSGTGENKNASTASLQMIMRNKYGWDKAEKEKKSSGNTAQDIIDVANGDD